jgi:DNA-binding response OmpR family regulator
MTMNPSPSPAQVAVVVQPPLTDRPDLRLEAHPFQPPGRLLIADDDDLFGRFLNEYLTRCGYRCTLVTDAAAAAGQLRETEFDLLLADIQMPGNAELELIRGLPQIVAGLPVVLITGRPSVETAARSVRLSVVAYLLKPPNLDELRAVVRQGVANYRHVRDVVATRQRLQEWNLDLERIEYLLRHAPADSPQSPVNSWMSITLRNLMLALMDLKHLATTVSGQPGSEQTVEQAELLSALSKTVAVLEHTRRHFKSKELGELRKELEEVLRQRGKPPEASPPPTGEARPVG